MPGKQGVFYMFWELNPNRERANYNINLELLQKSLLLKMGIYSQ